MNTKDREPAREMDFDEANKRMISFSGKIIETTLVTNNPSAADKWVQNIILKHHNQIIIAGFDCKYTTTHPIRSMNKQISSLQLCIGPAACLVLKLSHLNNSIPESVKLFLTNPNLCLFGVEVHDNVMKLERGYGVKCCGKVVDIRAFVKVMFPLSHCCCRRKVSLRGIAYKVAGLSVRERNKNAGDDEDELVESASVDAYACFMIAHNFLN